MDWSPYLCLNRTMGASWLCWAEYVMGKDGRELFVLQIREWFQEETLSDVSKLNSFVRHKSILYTGYVFLILRKSIMYDKRIAIKRYLVL